MLLFAFLMVCSLKNISSVVIYINIYSLKNDSAIIFPRGTKPLLMTWTLTSFIYFVLYGDIYGFLSSQPDSSTLAGFRMTEPKQWWLATWPSHDSATCSLRHFWLGLRGSDIQSNAVIHTHPRQVCTHSDLACFRFLGSPPPVGDANISEKHCELQNLQHRHNSHENTYSILLRLFEFCSVCTLKYSPLALNVMYTKDHVLWAECFCKGLI